MNLIKLQKITNDLLDFLSSKSKDILIDRFGLNGEKPKTLEAVGKNLGVTRERIRQIESAGFKTLKKVEKSDKISGVFDFLEGEIIKKGGILDEKGLEITIFGKKGLGLAQLNQLRFIMNSSDKFYYQKQGIKFGGIWYIDGEKDNVANLKMAHDRLVSYFTKNKELMKFSEILKIVRQNNFCDIECLDFFDGVQGKIRLKILLRSSKLINKNIINQWGLMSWKMISQKGSREKAYLIYKKYKKPLHFRELTECINEHWGSEKKALPQTVHNAIIMYDEFVSVESGVYALREWDIFDEYVQEKITEFLEREAAFVEIEKIVEYVSLKKKVKYFAIQAILHNKDLFTRRNDRYMLR